MAEGYKSGLIAALRGDGDYSGPRAGRGPQALNFDWGKGAGLNLRRRASGGALNPARLTIPAGPGFAANQRIGSDSSYLDFNSPTWALPTTITPFPKNEQIVATEPQFFEPDMNDFQFMLPNTTFEPEPQRDVNISYEELVDANPWNTSPTPKQTATDVALVKPSPNQNVSISYEELVDPDPWNTQAPPADAVKKDPEVAITYEELVDPNPWNVQAPVADAVKEDPKVAITYEELVDPNPWNINAPPAEIAQEQDPEVAVTVEEIPEPEPSTLRETLASLIPAAAVPADMPVPEPEPEGTVTVEEVPDAPIVSDGRPSGGGYTLNTGLSRELMMLAALADMIGSADPEGQITIEELEDFR